MSNVPKRRGSSGPNRGGGRQGRPTSKGGRGRGSGGGGTTKPPSTSVGGAGKYYGNLVKANADDMVLDFKAKPEQTTTIPKPTRRTFKIAMQKLSMTPENQTMVLDTLLHLNDNPDLAKAEGFPQASNLPSPLDSAMDDVMRTLPRSHQFKLDNKLVVEDSVSNTARTDDDPEILYQFPVKKIQKYGFDRGRCLDALTTQDGDIGGSIELLLSQCLPGIHSDLTTTPEDAKEERDNEALALSSIYEEKFTEKIPDRIWFVDLDLPQLTKLTVTKNDCPSSLDDQRPICPFYLKGHCKFGNRCRMRHASKAELDADQERASQCLFSVEIRFPPESLYPYQPPLVAFLSHSYHVKPELCLKISCRMMQEAAELSLDGAPAVYTILALLDDEVELKRLVDAPLHPLSLAPKKLAPKPELLDESFGESTDNFSDDSDTESLPEIKEYLTPEIKFGKDKPQETAVILALRRKIKENKLYDKTMERLQQDNVTIRRKFKKMKSNITYQKLVNHRKELPAWGKKGDIVSTVQKSQVTVISGTTGCGKTTQVPQFILDACIEDSTCDLGQIVCTQPRRISALAVAERVAEERHERLGDVVGYQIRLESRMSSYTRLMYCTTGILLRRLETDSSLVGVSHVIIDEVHERSEDSDFLMMILRDLCRKRSDLKLILMSATLNADLFSQYFKACPVIDIPGKTFPVARRYLEDVIEVTEYTLEEGDPYARPKTAAPLKDRKLRELRDHDIDDETNGEGPTAVKGKIADRYLNTKQLGLRYIDYKMSTVKTMAKMDLDKINNDLIEDLLIYILRTDLGFPRDGAILIFLPGFMEINALFEQLSATKPFRDRARFRLIPLHSTLSSEEQQMVFNKSKPGVTKIVLATNIAETSITIDDVVYVIDAGRMKERSYDSDRNMESLDLTWVSCANAIQREGRAGRVAPGICYHLFTSNQFRHQFRDQPIPEIQRVPLERMVLKILILELFRDINVKDVFSQLLEPPSDEAIVSALERLQDLGALDREQRLTPLGYHLAFLPVDVRIGKLMLFGVIMRCLDPVLTMAASLSYKTPFLSPFSKREEADACKHSFSSMNSDHLTILKAYNAWLEADKVGNGYSFCNDNFLSVKTLKMLASLKRQYVELLSDIGFVDGDVSKRRLERSACRGSDGVKENLPPQLNSNASNLKILSSVLCAALYPQVVQMITPESRFVGSVTGAMAKQPKAEELKFKTKTDGYVFIHPSSVNFSVRHYDSPFLVYHEKIKTSKVYLRDCSMVTPYSLILFAGGEVHISLDQNKFVLFIDDGWIRFTAQNYDVASLVRKLREKFDHLLQEKIENPEMNLATCPRSNKIIQTIVTLLSSQ